MRPGGWGLRSGRSREPGQPTLRSPLAVRRAGPVRRSVKLQEPRGMMMRSLSEKPWTRRRLRPRSRRAEVTNYFKEEMGSSTSCEADDLKKKLVHASLCAFGR
mmetsp:Transcript_95447/g.256605  ORF Transcript_95447/g.256605 Transcript_95447/m.256605 type:complete len:103 (-) Transcript_95447:106-414(-)